MTIFNLPDLGEGLPDAEIHEWHVKVGDQITLDEPLVSMETAKAIVDVPAPVTGTISKLYGKLGDIIKTGEPLVEFATSAAQQDTQASTTVVGNIETSDETLEEASSVMSQGAAKTASPYKATPAVRALAKRLSIDLAQVKPQREDGLITAEDVKQHEQMLASAATLEPLRGVRRTMAGIMATAHAEVVPVTLYDDADIHRWQADTDITVRTIQAIAAACRAEPALNAWYDSKAVGRRLHKTIDLGLAVDTEEGLFVPVIKDVGALDATQLRQHINQLKQQIKDRAVPPEQLRGATITLSNFGMFAGRYANPIVIPPTVAIIGTGKIRDQVVAEQGEPAIHRIYPLSLTFDHRAVTGGEATRFLKVVIEQLQQA